MRINPITGQSFLTDNLQNAGCVFYNARLYFLLYTFGGVYE